eukprot:m51a1_g1747 hypothetical protein (142) ;mRNA; r:198781-199206
MWTCVKLVDHLRTKLGASGSGKKDVLVRRVLDHEGFGAKAISGRLRAFLDDRTVGRPLQIALYKLLFNLVDRLDVLLSYIPFPWKVESFPLVFLIWLVRVTIVAAFAATSDYKWDYTDLTGDYAELRAYITTFARDLANNV